MDPKEDKYSDKMRTTQWIFKIQNAEYNRITSGFQISWAAHLYELYFMSYVLQVISYELYSMNYIQQVYSLSYILQVIFY